jgi:DNA-binding phage protein
MAAPIFQTQRTTPKTASTVVKKLFGIMKEDRRRIVDVAVSLNMTSTGLQYWKSGRTDPSITNVEALAQELGFRLVLEPIEDTHENS